MGAAVGTGLGALTGLALVAGSVSLFVASPLIAPLMILGWGASLGASLGGFLGAAICAGNKEGKFSELIRDAIASGQVVLTAETRFEAQTITAREVIKAAVGGSIERTRMCARMNTGARRDDAEAPRDRAAHQRRANADQNPLAKEPDHHEICQND